MRLWTSQSLLISDKDNSGGISYIERLKVKQFHDIIKLAHAQAGYPNADRTDIMKQKDVGFDDFLNLLIHLFAISILWVNLKNADMTLGISHCHFRGLK